MRDTLAVAYEHGLEPVESPAKPVRCPDRYPQSQSGHRFPTTSQPDQQRREAETDLDQSSPPKVNAALCEDERHDHRSPAL